MVSQLFTPIRLGIAATLFSMSAIAYVLWLHNPSVVEEHHVVEWTQVAILIAAASVYTFKARTMTTRADHIVWLALALICVSFAVREIDIDKLSSAEVMPTVEIIVRASIVFAWLILVWRALLWSEMLWSRRSVIALSSVGILTIAAGLLYAVSAVFDKHPEAFGMEWARFIEEVMQLNATLLLFVASCCTLPAIIAVRAESQ